MATVAAQDKVAAAAQPGGRSSAADAGRSASFGRKKHSASRRCTPEAKSNEDLDIMRLRQLQHAPEVLLAGQRSKMVRAAGGRPAQRDARSMLSPGDMLQFVAVDPHRGPTSAASSGRERGEHGASGVLCRQDVHIFARCVHIFERCVHIFGFVGLRSRPHARRDPESAPRARPTLSYLPLGKAMVGTGRNL